MNQKYIYIYIFSLHFLRNQTDFQGASFLTSNPTELFSPSNPRYCRALVPLSTAVTAEQNKFATCFSHQAIKNVISQNEKKKNDQETNQSHPIPLQDDIFSNLSMTFRSTWLSSTARTCSSPEPIWESAESSKLSGKLGLNTSLAIAIEPCRAWRGVFSARQLKWVRVETIKKQREAEYFWRRSVGCVRKALKSVYRGEAYEGGNRERWVGFLL